MALTVTGKWCLCELRRVQGGSKATESPIVVQGRWSLERMGLSVENIC